MTMVYTPDGLLYTEIPLAELAAMNSTDATVDVRLWEFSGISEEAARKRAIFNNWFLSVMKRRFVLADGFDYQPDSRYRVLPADLERVVVERLEHNWITRGCPCPRQPHTDPNQIAYLWALWLLGRHCKHNDVRSGDGDEWDILDHEADEEERGYTQDVQRREHEAAYKKHLAGRPANVKQKIAITGHPRLLSQLIDFISLQNRHLEHREDATEFEYLSELPTVQVNKVSGGG